MRSCYVYEECVRINYNAYCIMYARRETSGRRRRRSPLMPTRPNPINPCTYRGYSVILLARKTRSRICMTLHGIRRRRLETVVVAADKNFTCGEKEKKIGIEKRIKYS